MKLRYQIAILLGVPLLLQLIFVGVLIGELLNVNAAARKEAEAKKVIAACLDVRMELVRYLSYFRARQFFNPDSATRYRDNVEKVVKVKIDSLNNLVKSDPEGKEIVDRYGKKVRRFENLMADAGGSVENGMPEITLTRFIKENELYEEIVSSFNSIVKDEESLVTKYRAVDELLSVDSQKSRESLINRIIAAAILDTVVVLILSLFIGQKTLRKLSVLMDNIARFSKGDTKLENIEGNDELSEIDLEFREMADARAKAEELRRSLVAMVSHDIRSPLTSVGLNLSMIMEMHEETLDPKVTEKIRKTDGEIQRLVKLADGLLEIEKIEFGHVELDCTWIDPNLLLDTSCHAVSGIADSKRIKIEVNQDEEVDLYCDADRITQVLVNLMSNAIKFSPANSILTINLRQSKSEVKFEVIDQGVGIASEDQEKLFQKFTQLDQVKQLRKIGSGLGLYISRMLIEAHGGTIGYSRPENGGSCFWFVLKIPDLGIDSDEGEMSQTAS